MLKDCFVLLFTAATIPALYAVEWAASNMALWTNLTDDPNWLAQRNTTPRHWMVWFGVAVAAALLFRVGLSDLAAWSIVVLFLVYYMAAVDIRDFWLPDHATVLFLVIGLMWSPFTPAPIERIHGFGVAVGIFAIIGLLVNFLRYGRVAFDNFSGGDLVMGAGIGAWFGVIPMMIILLTAFGVGLLSNITRRLMHRCSADSQSSKKREAQAEWTARHMPEPLGVGLAIAVMVWLVVNQPVCRTLYLHGWLFSI